MKRLRKETLLNAPKSVSKGDCKSAKHSHVTTEDRGAELAQSTCHDIVATQSKAVFEALKLAVKRPAMETTQGLHSFAVSAYFPLFVFNGSYPRH